MISNANGSTARAVGEDNAVLVGLLRAGVSLAPPGQPSAEWTTLVDDSLEALAARLDRPLYDVIDAAAGVRGLLQPDVKVAVPAATLRSTAADLQAPLALLVDLVADQPYLLRLGARIVDPRLGQKPRRFVERH